MASKGVHVGATRLVLLLHLDREEFLFELQVVGPWLAAVLQRGDGPDAFIYASVTAPRFIRDAAERDARPVLKTRRGRAAYQGSSKNR